MGARKLVPPRNLSIDFKPSAKQYELWQLLEPDRCDKCGGHIHQVMIGYDEKGNEKYVPECERCHNQDLAEIILGGGAAGGGKSYIGVSWLAISCLQFEGIRAVLCRKTLKSLRESTWNTLLTVLRSWGLKENENYAINNIYGTLEFYNGSVIIMKDLAESPSDPDFNSLGSSEYTIAFVDEVSEISAKAIEVLSSRLRWKIHETFKVPKLLMTTNPCLGWVRDRFVLDENLEPVVLAQYHRYVPFSVYDNPNIAFRQIYEASLNKIKDQATKARLLYGNWCFVKSNDVAAYQSFNGEKHLVTGLKENVYDPFRPVILSFDFNVFPHMTCMVIQIDYVGKNVYFLEEILGKPKEKMNNSPQLAKYIKEKLLEEKHIGGIVITGDPAGTARSTQTEEGVNNFTIIENTLNEGALSATTKLLSKQPPQKTRLEWINKLFAGDEEWTIYIDMRCRKLTEDLIYQTTNEDGTKNKAKVTDPETLVKYEKYGHCSDTLDYVLCTFLSDSWGKYQRRGASAIPTITTAIITPNFMY